MFQDLANIWLEWLSWYIPHRHNTSDSCTPSANWKGCFQWCSALNAKIIGAWPWLLFLGVCAWRESMQFWFKILCWIKMLGITTQTHGVHTKYCAVRSATENAADVIKSEEREDVKVQLHVMYSSCIPCPTGTSGGFMSACFCTTHSPAAPCTWVFFASSISPWFRFSHQW